MYRLIIFCICLVLYADGKSWKCDPASGKCECKGDDSNMPPTTTDPMSGVEEPPTTPPTTTEPPTTTPPSAAVDTCKDTKANVAALCKPPDPNSVCWTYYAHKTSASSVKLLNKQQIELTDFEYDGTGPATWFNIKLRPKEAKDYKDDNVEKCGEDNQKNTIVPDDKNLCKKLREYKKEKVVLTLPGTTTWAEVDYIGLYCFRAGVIFGYVRIPASIDVSKLADFAAPTPATEDCEAKKMELFKEVGISEKDTTDQFGTCDNANTFKVTNKKMEVVCRP